MSIYVMVLWPIIITLASMCTRNNDGILHTLMNPNVEKLQIQDSNAENQSTPVNQMEFNVTSLLR